MCAAVCCDRQRYREMFDDLGIESRSPGINRRPTRTMWEIFLIFYVFTFCVWNHFCSGQTDLKNQSRSVDRYRVAAFFNFLKLSQNIYSFLFDFYHMILNYRETTVSSRYVLKSVFFLRISRCHNSVDFELRAIEVQLEKNDSKIRSIWIQCQNAGWLFIYSLFASHILNVLKMLGFSQNFNINIRVL